MKITSLNQSSNFSRIQVCRNGRDIATRCMAGIVMSLAFGACFSNEDLLAQSPVTPEQLIDIDYHDGHLSVSARNTMLIELMQKIGAKTGFKVAVFGDFGSQTGSWSFSNLPLAKAIEKMLSGTSAIISYSRGGNLSSEPSVSTVYMLGSWSAGENVIRFNNVEPSLTNQLLMDQAKSNNLQDRKETIDRLEGLADALTVTSLVFSLQHDPDPTVRSRAVNALEKIGGSIAATALEMGLGDDDSSVRMKVVQALGKIQDERTSIWLGQILMGDPNADVRLQAVHAIAQKNNDTTRIFLKAAADDSSSRVSKAAARLLE